jgi:predicted RNase H-like HicB family nuclease
MAGSRKMKLIMELPIKVTKKEEWFVAACPALDVVSQGDTAVEAKAHLAEALQLFLHSCLERGSLDAVLKDCGFSPVSGPIGEDDIAEDKIDIPLHLLAVLSEPDQCHHAQPQSTGRSWSASFSRPGLPLNVNQAITEPM